MNLCDPALHYDVAMASILLIDDDLAFLQILQQQLRDSGCEVSAATNGVDGVVKFDKGNFDLVIVDVMLPGGGGIWTINHIRHNKFQIPIIAISGDRSCLDDIEDYGSDKALLKPFHFDELQKAIHELL